MYRFGRVYMERGAERLYPSAENTLFIVFSPDSTQVELFFSEEDSPNEILDRRSLPAGGYAWNMEDDDTKNVRLENGKWTVGQRGKLIYKQVADK